MKSAWKIVQPNRKPMPYSARRFTHSGSRNGERTAAATGDAMHGRPDNLTPSSPNVLCVDSGQRFTAREDVEHETDRAGEEGDNHETPHQHRGFGCSLNVARNEHKRGDHFREPEQHDPVEHQVGTSIVWASIVWRV